MPNPTKNRVSLASVGPFFVMKRIDAKVNEHSVFPCNLFLLCLTGPYGRLR